LYKFVYLLRKKLEAFEHFQKFHSHVTSLHSCPIKNITTNSGGEFNSLKFKEFLASKGIMSHITAPYTPQQNPIAKRGNCTTTEKARTMLKQANLPLSLWGYAVETAVFLENVTPTKRNSWEAAYHLWFHCPFDYLRLRPFGCRAYVNIPKSKRTSKFADTARKGILVGYNQLGMHNWRILREDGQMELSHNIKSNKALYQGISLFNPAGLLTPPTEIKEIFDNDSLLESGKINNIPPEPDNSDLSDNLDEDVKRQLRTNPLPPLPVSDDKEEPSMPSGMSPACPGYDMVLQPVGQKAPKDISLTIDKSNNKTTRSRGYC
jgi:hypothetical protein